MSDIFNILTSTITLLECNQIVFQVVFNIISENDVSHHTYATMYIIKATSRSPFKNGFDFTYEFEICYF